MPKTSLLFETRAAPTAGAVYKDWPEFSSAWRRAETSDGAEFVGKIVGGLNPFGEQLNFMSHYSGWLLPPEGELVLYTLSSDASFVFADDKPVLNWPGVHSGKSYETDVHKASVPNPGGPIKIDYYQAKGGQGTPQSALGWKTEAGLKIIQPDSWLHPGSCRTIRFEAQGKPAPVASLRLRSYLGWAGKWLYEINCTLERSDLGGWSIEWHFSDGTVLNGPECNRIIADSIPQVVTVEAKRGNEMVKTSQRMPAFGAPARNAAHAEGNSRYIQELRADTPANWSPAALSSVMPFLIEFGSDSDVAPYAEAWFKLRPPPSEPSWLPAQLARLRFRAQTDPKEALTELRAIDFAAHNLYEKQLSLFEIDVLVYFMHDPSALGRAQQVALLFPDSTEGRLARIRVGDYYRLAGDVNKAAQQYASAQRTDESGGRKLPAQDQAFSMTIRDMLDNDYSHEANAKLQEWELNHPMAKLSTDFPSPSQPCPHAFRSLARGPRRARGIRRHTSG